MMFVDESVESPAGINENVAQSFVHGSTLVTHLIQHCLQHNDILDDFFFENVDLIENDVCVQQQIMTVTD